MSLGTYWWVSVDGPTEQAETPSKIPLAWFGPEVQVFIEITLKTLRDWIQQRYAKSVAFRATMSIQKRQTWAARGRPAKSLVTSRPENIVVNNGGWGQPLPQSVRLFQNVFVTLVIHEGFKTHAETV